MNICHNLALGLNCFGRRASSMRLFLILSVYKFLLGWLCSIFYSWRKFEYSFAFETLSWFIFAGSFFLFRIIVLLSKRMDDILKFLLLLLYMISYLPFTSLIGFRQVSIPLIVYNSIYFLVIGTACRLAVEFCSFKIPFIAAGRRLLTGVCVVTISIYLYFSYKYTSLRLYLSFDDVYVAGHGFKSLNVSKFWRIFFATFLWVTPYLISYFLVQRRLIMAILYTLSGISGYCACGSKFILLASVGGYIIVLFFNKKITVRRREFFCYLGIAVFLISGLAMKVSRTNIVADWTSRCLARMLFEVNFAVIHYFNFFIETHHPPEYFLQFLSHFIEVPVRYHSAINPVPLLIGRIYYDTECWCCSGLLGTAVMRLGYPGIFVMPFFHVFILLFFSRLVVALDERLQVLFSFFLAFSIINGSVDIHFVCTLFFYLYLMGSTGNSKKSCNSSQ